MKVLNQLFRQFTQALITSMIICTLVFLPYPANLNNAYAEDSNTTDIAETDGGVECDDGTGGTNGGADVYRVGCEFNEDLAKSKAENHYGDGTKGIVEQFVTAIFALIGVSLFFTPSPLSVAECPMNQGGSISIPIVQAGSLAYLIGDISANAKFKEASKMAVDHSFQAKEDEKKEDAEESKKAKEKNNAQLEAYATLMKIYEKQAEGLDKKIQMSTLSELAFLTAFGFELTNIIQCKTQCEAIATKLTAADTLLQGKLETLTAAATAEGVEYMAEYTACASSVVGAATCLPLEAAALSCKALAGEVTSYVTLLTSNTLKTGAMNAAEIAEKETTSTVDEKANTTAFSTTIAALGSAGVILPVAPIGKKKTEMAKDTANATKADAYSTSVKAARRTLISTIETTGVGCVKSIGPIVAALEAIESGRLAPVHCCGISSTFPNLDTTNMKAAAFATAASKAKKAGEAATKAVADASLMAINLNASDIGTSIFDQVNDNATPFQVANHIDKNKKYYVKAIVENTLRRISYSMVDKKKGISAERKISLLANSEKYIRYILENQDALLHDSNLKAEFEKIQSFDDKDRDNLILSFIDKVKNELVIDIAHANEFKELLNIGVKVLMLYLALNSWLQENALGKPKTRAWTWGIMAAVNLIVLNFNQDAKKKAEKRYEVTRLEAQRFANSHALRFAIDTGESKDSTNMKLAKQTRKAVGYSKAGVRACAVPKGSGFAPAMCPSVTARKRFSFPTSNRITGGANQPLAQGMGLLSDGAFSASTAGIIDENSKVSGVLSQYNKLKPAIKARNEQLIKELDKLETKGLKGSDTKNKRAALLSRSLARAKKAIVGSGNPTAALSQNLAGNSKLLPELEKLKTDLGKKAKSAGINLGSGSTVTTPQTPSFDFDLGDDSDSGSTVSDMGVGTAGEESLTDFQVNSGEINENTGVSIFKLISNRYLRSYPVLLEENKK